jgi:hypothetical protein
MSRLKDICFDCEHPWELAEWWAETLGYETRRHPRAASGDPSDDDVFAADPVGESGPTFWFNRVPEEKVAKNRVHVDVYGDADELIARGATLVDRLPRWTILTDPEGNEFCVFAT